MQRHHRGRTRSPEQPPAYLLRSVSTEPLRRLRNRHTSRGTSCRASDPQVKDQSRLTLPVPPGHRCRKARFLVRCFGGRLPPNVRAMMTNSRHRQSPCFPRRILSHSRCMPPPTTPPRRRPPRRHPPLSGGSTCVSVPAPARPTATRFIGIAIVRRLGGHDVRSHVSPLCSSRRRAAPPRGPCGCRKTNARECGFAMAISTVRTARSLTIWMPSVSLNGRFVPLTDRTRRTERGTSNPVVDRAVSRADRGGDVRCCERSVHAGTVRQGLCRFPDRNLANPRRLGSHRRGVRGIARPTPALGRRDRIGSRHGPGGRWGGGAASEPNDGR